jgi:hypothetical protein
VTAQQYEEEGIINNSIGDCFQAKAKEAKVTLFPNPQYSCFADQKSNKKLESCNLSAQQGSQLKIRRRICRDPYYSTR